MRLLMRLLSRCMRCAVVLLLMSAPSFAQTQTERFDVDRFHIEGNTLLKTDEIEAVLRPFTGKQRDYGNVQRAIEALRRLYRTSGFSVVWVVAPEQDLDRGIVTLRVIEAAIGRVTIEGNRYFDDSNIRSSLPALREGASPRAGDISANVQLANENPAKQVDVGLRPSEKRGVVECGRRRRRCTAAQGLPDL